MMPKTIFAFVIAVLVIAGVAVGTAFYFTVDLLQSENIALNSKLRNLGNQIALVENSVGIITGKNNQVESSLKELSTSFSMEKTQDDLLTEAVAKVTPAVVSVVVSKTTAKLEIVYVNPFGDDPIFKDVNVRVPVYKQGPATEKQIAAGSGFVVDPRGYIVTNNHVVDVADGFITVLLSNGKQESAKVIYKDKEHDVAIIKIEAKNLSAVKFGNSNELKLGQTVIAIGNALGTYNNTVSTGIVSGLNREISAISNKNTITLKGLIQTDAAINKGNSGGPLISLDGKVIGVNVATATSAEGIGFAITSNEVKDIVDKQI